MDNAKGGFKNSHPPKNKESSLKEYDRCRPSKEIKMKPIGTGFRLDWQVGRGFLLSLEFERKKKVITRENIRITVLWRSIFRKCCRMNKF